MNQNFPDTPRERLTGEARKARDAERRAAAAVAIAEHEREQKRLYENRERLKAERLAREVAATGGNAKAKPKPKPK